MSLGLLCTAAQAIHTPLCSVDIDMQHCLFTRSNMLHILHSLYMQTKARNVVPTIGFNVEVFKHDK